MLYNTTLGVSWKCLCKFGQISMHCSRAHPSAIMSLSSIAQQWKVGGNVKITSQGGVLLSLLRVKRNMRNSFLCPQLEVLMLR
jgi:hypothetical protein